MLQLLQHISRVSTDTNTTASTSHQPHSSLKQVMYQFTQMRTMLSLKMEGLEEKDFHTFRNEDVKLLSTIQSRAEEHGHQVQQQTLSWSSSATSTVVSQTFQQPQQPAPATREYILIIPETQMPASQVIQQTGASRPLTFTLKPMKHFKPPSGLCYRCRKSTQQIRTFKLLQKSVMSYLQIDTRQPFSRANMPAPATSPPTTTAAQQEHQQPPAQPYSQPPMQRTNAKRQLQ